MTSNTRALISVAIIGGGIAGIAQAIRLKEELGDRVQFTIYERAKEIGGVWRDSKWPGAGVDVKIHLYQLYSDLNPYWNRAFANREEVYNYWQGLVDKHDIRPSIRYQTTFVGSEWIEKEQHHVVELRDASGETFSVVADVLISAAGPLNTPNIPKLPGIEAFNGVAFHSSQWNPDISLKGKRVAVVGNGSTGIQVVPNIATNPGIQIKHFIRSPGYFLPKVNYCYPSIVKFAFAWIPGLQRLYRAYIFFSWEGKSFVSGASWLGKLLRQRSEKALVEYLRSTAPIEYHKDLTPNYPLGAKRVAWDAGWLQSLHRDNVELVSSEIVAVNKDGIVTKDGKEHKLDVIVWATGFDISGEGVGLNKGVKGQNGRELRQYWESLGGPEAYLAVAVPKWPNYFIVIGPNAVSASWGYTIGNQTRFIARLVGSLVKNNLTSLVPRLEPFEAHNRFLQSHFTDTVYRANVRSWYKYKGMGKVVAPSGFSAQLWWRTRSIVWNDWIAVGRRAGEKGGLLQVVDVAAVRRKRAAVKLLLASVPLAAILATALGPWGQPLLERIQRLTGVDLAAHLREAGRAVKGLLGR